MAKLRGRDVLKPSEIRSQLEELNAEALDVPTVDGRTPPGSYGVAIFADVDERGVTTGARVQCVDAVDRADIEPVVWIPGFGHPFPVKAYVEALLVAEVLSRP